MKIDSLKEKLNEALEPFRKDSPIPVDETLIKIKSVLTSNEEFREFANWLTITGVSRDGLLTYGVYIGIRLAELGK